MAHMEYNIEQWLMGRGGGGVKVIRGTGLGPKFWEKWKKMTRQQPHICSYELNGTGSHHFLFALGAQAHPFTAFMERRKWVQLYVHI